MLMKMEDLEPGDKIKITKEYEPDSLLWTYSHKYGTLEVTKIETGIDYVCVWHRPIKNSRLMALYLKLERETGRPYGTEDNGRGAVFEVVELKGE